MSLASLTSRHTLNLERQSKATRDSSGGFIQNWDLLVADVQGDLQPAGAGLRAQYASQQMTVTHRFFSQSYLPARAGDRFAGNGRVFIVQGTFDTVERGRLFIADLEEQVLQPGAGP